MQLTAGEAANLAVSEIGSLYLATEDHRQAAQYYRQALKIAVDRQDTELSLRVLTDLATLLANPANRDEEQKVHPTGQAAELAFLVLDHPDSAEKTKSKAEALLRELEGQLARDALVQARERSQARDLWATAEALLAGLEA